MISSRQHLILVLIALLGVASYTGWRARQLSLMERAYERLVHTHGPADWTSVVAEDERTHYRQVRVASTGDGGIVVYGVYSAEFFDDEETWVVLERRDRHGLIVDYQYVTATFLGVSWFVWVVVFGFIAWLIGAYCVWITGVMLSKLRERRGARRGFDVIVAELAE